MHKDSIYFGSWDGYLYSLSVKDKELLWKFRTALGFPSFIRKPTLMDRGKEEVKFIQTQTTKGYDVKSDTYSRVTGERTNAFYASPIRYKNNGAYGI